MNPFQMIGNPKGFLFQQLQSRMDAMMKQNPQAYQKMQEMTAGKSESDMKQTAMNMARERGIDLQKFAGQFGIKV